MSQAKREICRGCLERNEQCFQGCLKRNMQYFEDVSSETDKYFEDVSSGTINSLRMSQPRRIIVED
eukprot:3813155-Pyramimonas_sp.AAC.1